MTTHYAKKNGWVIVDTITLDDHSATRGEQLPELQRLILRKRERNDFDALLFADFQRFVRNVDDAQIFSGNFRRLGVKVITVKRGEHAGKWGPVFEVIEAVEGQAYVESSAWNTQSGVSEAIKDGRLPPCWRGMYGLDKLYSSAEGKPLFILHETSTQYTKIDPYTRKLIETLQKRKGERVFAKTRSQKMTFVPGDDQQVRVVNEIYQWFFSEEVGLGEIAARLNRRGEPSPKGTLWYNTTVRHILMNSAYTGTITGNRIRYGCILERTSGEPLLYETPRRPEEGRTTFPIELKPSSAWQRADAPALHDFLPEKVRRVAKKWQEQEWRAWEAKSAFEETQKNICGRKRGGNRHDPAKYPLSNILRAHDGVPMNGTCDGTRCRYYYRPAAAGVETRKRVRADEVEREVFETLQLTIGKWSRLETIIEKYAAKRHAELARNVADLPRLREKRSRLAQQYRMIMEDYGPKGREICREQAHRLEAAIADLDYKIDSATPARLDIETKRQLVKRLRSEISDLLQLVKEQKLKSLRRLAQKFVRRLEWDTERKCLYIEYLLPDWAFSTNAQLLDGLGLVEHRSRRALHETGPVLARFRSIYRMQGCRGRFMQREMLPAEPVRGSVRRLAAGGSHSARRCG